MFGEEKKIPQNVKIAIAVSSGSRTECLNSSHVRGLQNLHCAYEKESVNGEIKEILKKKRGNYHCTLQQSKRSNKPSMYSLLMRLIAMRKQRGTSWFLPFMQRRGKEHKSVFGSSHPAPGSFFPGVPFSFLSLFCLFCLFYFFRTQEIAFRLFLVLSTDLPFRSCLIWCFVYVRFF